MCPLISWWETSVWKQQIICTVYTHVSASRRLGNIYCPISEYIHMNMTKQSCTVSTLGACFTSDMYTKTETVGLIHLWTEQWAQWCHQRRTTTWIPLEFLHMLPHTIQQMYEIWIFSWNRLMRKMVAKKSGLRRGSGMDPGYSKTNQ